MMDPQASIEMMASVAECVIALLISSRSNISSSAIFSSVISWNVALIAIACPSVL